MNDAGLDRVWDVIVIGGGNAALVSAMSAHDEGASVLVLERADVVFRGGNSRHTRNIRCVHGDDNRYTTGAYTFAELWKDLCGVGTGPSNEQLADLTVRESTTATQWMAEHGAYFQKPLRGTLHLGRTNQFFLGGGKALVNAYYRSLAARGIPVLYEAKVTDFTFDGPVCTSIEVEVAGTPRVLRAKSFVVAAGGFEANIEWLSRYWGDAAKNYHIRGPAHNDGLVLAKLLEHGADQAGEERGFHSVAVDARSPKFDGGIATRLDAIPFGVVLNRDAERFYDEGEDIWPKRYAIWGRNLATQPDQIGYIFWDEKVNHQFLPPMYGVYSGSTIEDVARQMGMADPAKAEATVRRYNDACSDGEFNPAHLDGLATRGLTPPKTNWAQRIDQGPFYGISARPGITFTYLGVRVDESARIQRVGEEPFANVFAAGEIMSGNILSSGYMAGFGMTIGTVWGRIAGRQAARAEVR